MQPRTAQDWLDLVLDPDWVERDADVTAGDPLGFPGYADRDAKQESVVSADGTVEGHDVVAISFDFSIFGGTMGVAAGEKIARAFERAGDRRAAVLALTASGGARLQEGMLALAQMAKTVLARRGLTAAQLPFLAYLRNPTTGGVYASFAALADVIWAEPGATIGFAGPRVAEQEAPLPEGSHTAEFGLARGLIDDVVHPHELRDAVVRLLTVTTAADTPTIPAESAAVPSPAGTGWNLVERARHPERPAGRKVAEGLSPELIELRGDRAGTNDAGVVTGLGRICGRRAGIVALDRSRPTPPGYRKAYRLLRLAAALNLPLVTIIDTPGAEASSSSEAAGIARTIGTTIRTVLEYPAPTVAVVTGEGGSGGALALACCDRVLICSGATFSVIAPESAAAILRRDDVERVAEELRLGAADLLSFGLADAIVEEPAGGAHSDPSGFVAGVTAAVAEALDELGGMAASDRLDARRRRWRNAGNAIAL